MFSSHMLRLRLSPRIQSFDMVVFTPWHRLMQGPQTVMSFAFLLFKNPGQVPRIVQLPSEGYNPYVQCGATLVLGITCAGIGLQDAVEILKPMTKDSVNFVHQGAFIALGMCLIQQSEASSASLASTHALYMKVVSDKHKDPMYVSFWCCPWARVYRCWLSQCHNQPTELHQQQEHQCHCGYGYVLSILVLVSLGALCMVGFKTNGNHWPQWRSQGKAC